MGLKSRSANPAEWRDIPLCSGTVVHVVQGLTKVADQRLTFNTKYLRIYFSYRRLCDYNLRRNAAPASRGLLGTMASTGTWLAYYFWWLRLWRGKPC